MSKQPVTLEDLHRKLVGLAGEVASMGERLDAVEAVPASSAAGAEDVAKLREDLTKLSGIVAEALTEQAEAGDVEGADVPGPLDLGEGREPVAWVEMTNPDAAAAFLVDLAAWTRKALPPEVSRKRLEHCWPKHPIMIQFLADLRVVWTAIYHPAEDRPPRPSEAMEWHTRYLPALTEAIREELGYCLGEHEDPKIYDSKDQPVSDDELGAIARTWAGARAS